MAKASTLFKINERGLYASYSLIFISKESVVHSEKSIASLILYRYFLLCKLLIKFCTTMPTYGTT